MEAHLLELVAPASENRLVLAHNTMDELDNLAVDRSSGPSGGGWGNGYLGADFRKCQTRSTKIKQSIKIQRQPKYQNT